MGQIIMTRQESSMIHLARITVSSVANIVFAWTLFCFEKSGLTDGRTTSAKIKITPGWVGPRGSIMIISLQISPVRVRKFLALFISEWWIRPKSFLIEKEVLHIVSRDRVTDFFCWAVCLCIFSCTTQLLCIDIIIWTTVLLLLLLRNIIFARLIVRTSNHVLYDSNVSRLARPEFFSLRTQIEKMFGLASLVTNV